MKQSTLLVAAATSLLVSGSAIAQTVAGHGPYRLDEQNAAAAVEAEYRIVDSLGNSFSFYSTNQDPFKYDPLLNVLAFIKRGNPIQTGNTLFIRSSTDMGMTWSNSIGPLLDPAASGMAPARYPSLVINPTKSTNLQEFFYYWTAPILSGPAGAFGGFATGLISQSGAEIIPAQPSAGIGTDLWSSDSRAVASADGSTVISANSIDGNAIAIRRLDLNSGTLTEEIPAQLAGDMFTPSETEGSRTSTTGGIGVDPNGAIYLMLWARTPGTDAGLGGDLMAQPLLTKSTDNGATWSDMVQLPGQQLIDFAAAQGFTAGEWTTSYGPTGFAVTGADRASMIFGLYNQDTTREDGPNMIVEARYNNGTWNLFKVSDITGSWMLLDEDAAERGNQLENEIQMSMTADGQTLVAKWVDLINYLYESDDINGDGEADDTLLTTDVFIATRPVNQGTWSDRKNITESPILDRQAWIPVGVVPNDLSSLPLLTIKTIPSEEDITIADQLVNGQTILVTRQQYVVMSNVDANVAPTAAPIAGEATKSSVRSIAPNPTSGSAVITVNVAKSGAGSVEIWNALGQRVASLDNGTLQAGTRTYNLGGVELPTGAYRVALTIDGQTVTQPFSVVR